MKNLAIIIPYFKIKYFKKTLESIEHQTNRRFNLYIGNDASKDNPEELLKTTLINTPYKYFNYPQNFGGINLVKQWNRVINDSGNEEWFMILGDDDVLSLNFVEAFFEALDDIKKHQCNVVKYSQCWINEAGQKITDFTKYEKLINPADNLEYKIMKGERSSLSEYIFRKKQYLKFNFKDFPLAWATDDIAVLEFSERMPIYFIHNSKVYVRISNENISGRTDNFTEKNNAKIAFEKYLIKKHYKNITKDSLLKMINNQIYYRYHFKTPLEFSLFKIYFYLGLYKKIIALPKTHLILHKILK